MIATLTAVLVVGGSTLAVSGPVKVNLTGAFTASGNSTVNPTLIPRNLQLAMSYTGSNGVAVVGSDTRLFLTDFRYMTQAAEQVTGLFGQ